MTYFITFLEGIITFISPCLLPMLPIYLSYFAGGNPDESQGTVLKNAVGFVLGFTTVFVAMGLLLAPSAPCFGNTRRPSISSAACWSFSLV